MTPDAWIDFALIAGIPFLMALGGGILAVKAIPKTAANKLTLEGWLWIAGFTAFAVFGFVLAAYQQVRVTNQETANRNKAESEKLESQQRISFMQGQLATISQYQGQLAGAMTSIAKSENNRNLDALAALLLAQARASYQASQISQPSQTTQVADVPHPPAQSSGTKFSNLNDAQLKGKVTSVSEDLKMVATCANATWNEPHTPNFRDICREILVRTPDDFEAAWREIYFRLSLKNQAKPADAEFGKSYSGSFHNPKAFRTDDAVNYLDGLMKRLLP